MEGERERWQKRGRRGDKGEGKKDEQRDGGRRQKQTLKGEEKEAIEFGKPQQGDLSLSGPTSGQGAVVGLESMTEGYLQISGWTQIKRHLTSGCNDLLKIENYLEPSAGLRTVGQKTKPLAQGPPLLVLISRYSSAGVSGDGPIARVYRLLACQVPSFTAPVTQVRQCYVFVDDRRLRLHALELCINQ
ncbi:hypothetical protein PoB_006234600 [Plakobranchus ocellatus]|uniref:Uncharacterized protein n=1 Tax=Plakobranchus ocellatus TaxID=259542 RepID=A0AAV4CVF5_9GAST|nr:hypothetical protein PoB_006234600 [Plakobranchus ocellatus]